jgi:hypothetical protein
MPLASNFVQVAAPSAVRHTVTAWPLHCVALVPDARSHPSFAFTNAIRAFAEMPCGSVRCVQLSPLSVERNKWSPLMNTQTTPLPAAAICAVVGSAIGVPDGAAEGGALGVGVALGVCVAAAVLVPVGVTLALGVDAAGLHATMRRIARESNLWFMTCNPPSAQWRT